MLQGEFSGFQIGNDPGDGAFLVADGDVVCRGEGFFAGVGHGDAYLGGVEHGNVVVVIANGDGLIGIKAKMTDKIADGCALANTFGQDLKKVKLGADIIKFSGTGVLQQGLLNSQDLFVNITAEKDTSVRMGDNIGAVGTIPCECSDQSHLHIEAFENGESVSILKFFE